jgi:hypothetical protein
LIDQCFDEPYQCNHIVIKLKAILSIEKKNMYGKCPQSNCDYTKMTLFVFVLKGSENLHARGRKTEKNITLASLGYIKSTYEQN